MLQSSRRGAGSTFVCINIKSIAPQLKRVKKLNRKTGKIKVTRVLSKDYKIFGKKKITRLLTRCLAMATNPPQSEVTPTATPTPISDSEPRDDNNNPLPTPTPTPVPCTHYASPNGNGNGLSPQNPFLVNSFWDVAQPGSVLCLLDGTYTGANSMINPPSGLNGVEGNPITVRAFNDGKVKLDAQHSSRAIELDNNNWFVVEGIDAYRGTIQVVIIANSQHNILRRVVAWDTNGGNSAVLQVYQSRFNLIEDCAFFGLARKTVSFSYGGDDTIVRRSFARWEGSVEIGPKQTYAIAYNNYRLLIENSIGTWDGVLMPDEPYELELYGGPCTGYPECGTYGAYQASEVVGIFGFDRIDGDKRAHSKILGSLAYTVPEQLTESEPGGTVRGFTVAKVADFEISNSISIQKTGIPPFWVSTPNYWGQHISYSATSGNSAIIATIPNNHYYQAVVSGVSGNAEPLWPTDGSLVMDGSVVWMDMGLLNLTFTNNAGIGTAASKVFGWNTSGYVSSTSVAGAYAPQTPFTSTATANLCKRYLNGVKTNQPLWPWPMNQRIVDAMTFAGRPVENINQRVTQLLGQIPPECCDSSQGSCAN